MKKKFAAITAGLALFGIAYAGVSYAGSITDINIWLNRYQDESSNVDYAFFPDVWGTVSEFQAITLTTPLKDTYPLSLANEGDQWDSEFKGTQAEVESLFTNGTYTFDVTYTDNNTESIDVQLGGALPPFPANLSLNGNLVTWDEWLTPIFPFHIQFVIGEEGYEASIEEYLFYTDTSFTLPEGFLKENTLYDIEVWFVSSENPNTFKASVSFASFIICAGDLDNDGDVDGADLAAYSTGQTSMSLIDFVAQFGRNICIQQ